MPFSLDGRVAVVFGVANKRSIAWSIAQGRLIPVLLINIIFHHRHLQLIRDLLFNIEVNRFPVNPAVPDDGLVAQVGKGQAESAFIPTAAY